MNFYNLFIYFFFAIFKILIKYPFNFFSLQRPPSSSLSYGGAMNEDARSPGAGSTPGPLSQQPPVLDTSDPGKWKNKFHFVFNF